MHLFRLIFCLATLAITTPCTATDVEKPGLLGPGTILMIQGAPTAIHYHSSPDYKGTHWLVGAELQYPSNWLGGYAYFNNSFDQRCHYLYAGYIWHFSDKNPNWYIKVTGGALEGYSGQYRDKIPLNSSGVAPAIVPGIGYKYDRFNAQINTFGTAGFMITVGYDLIR